MKSFRKRRYEGKEHVRFENPGMTKHKVRYPEDEPHMKSRVNSEEEHEAEDNYHMDRPHLTKYSLEKHIPRARMKMDERDKYNYLMGNLVTTNESKIKDGDGLEDEGPHYMQEDSNRNSKRYRKNEKDNEDDESEEEEEKEHRKRMIAVIVKKKMKKK